MSGWAVVAPGFTEAARRYVDQIALSLRPSTVAHVEHDLREFGTWLADPPAGDELSSPLDRPSRRPVGSSAKRRAILERIQLGVLA